MKQKLFFLAGVGFAIALLVVSIQLIRAQTNTSWQPPTANFPQGNTYPPIDTGPNGQTKEGNLTLSSIDAGKGQLIFGGYGKKVIELQSGQWIGSGDANFYLKSGLNTNLSNLSGAFYINTQGLVLPVIKEQNKPTGVTGMVYYEKDSNLIKYYNGSEWKDVGTGTVTVTGGAAVGWLRDNTNGFIYLATSTDKVGIGTNAPQEKLSLWNPSDPMSEPINFHIGGSQWIANNAYYDSALGVWKYSKSGIAYGIAFENGGMFLRSAGSSDEGKDVRWKDGISVKPAGVSVFGDTDDVLKLIRGANAFATFRVGTDSALVIQGKSGGAITLKGGGVNFGNEINTTPITVYGSGSVVSIPSQYPTNFYYEKVRAASSDFRSNYSPANANFNWWKAEFPNDFPVNSSWDSVKIKQPMLSSSPVCGDSSMTSTQCLEEIYLISNFQNPPEYVYDLTMSKEEGGANYAVGFRKFQKKASSRVGGNFYIEEDFTVDSLAGGQAQNKVLSTDASGKLVLVASGGPVTPGVWQNGASGAIYYNGGNVGIGTTGPGSKLEVNGNIAAVNSNPLIFLGPSNGAMTTANYHSIGYAAGANYHVTGSAVGDLTIGALANENIVIGTNTAGTPTARVTITNSGNVGIGTAAPGAKLEVAGQIKITGGSPGTDKVLTSDASGLATWKTAGGGSSPAFPLALPANNGFDFTFANNKWSGFNLSGGDAKRIIIGVDKNRTGNVFDIEDTTDWEHRMELRADGSAFFRKNVEVGVAEANNPQIRISDEGNSAMIQSYNGPLAINPLGNNVGIGVSSPESKLHVKGNINADADVGFTYTIDSVSASIRTTSVNIGGSTYAVNHCPLDTSANYCKDDYSGSFSNITDLGVGCVDWSKSEGSDCNIASNQLTRVFKKTSEGVANGVGIFDNSVVIGSAKNPVSHNPSITFSPSGSGSYTIKNDYGTLRFVSALGEKLSIGQDGVVLVTENVIIEKQLQIKGGMPADGRVLMSDASGNASWGQVLFPSSDAVGEKICSTIAASRDSVNVNDGWTLEDCRRYAKDVGAVYYHLGCMLSNGIVFGSRGETSTGAPNAGVPSPNCGWNTFPAMWLVLTSAPPNPQNGQTCVAWLTATGELGSQRRVNWSVSSAAGGRTGTAYDYCAYRTATTCSLQKENYSSPIEMPAMSCSEIGLGFSMSVRTQTFR